VSKNTRSPGAIAACVTSPATPYCSPTVLGTVIPCWAKTYQTNPLQSKPEGSLPPFRYGVPRRLKAVLVMAPISAVGAGVDSGASGAATGGEGWGEDPRAGRGNGSGFAPVEAQPTRVIRVSSVAQIRNMGAPLIIDERAAEAKHRPKMLETILLRSVVALTLTASVGQNGLSCPWSRRSF
jgi:hypothetical protein